MAGGKLAKSALVAGAIEQRAIVRAMAATIATDIHPLNNLRVLKYLKNYLGKSQEEIDGWAAHWIGEGFAALEVMIVRHGDGFAYGSSPTIADCCLVPQTYNADRIGFDLTQFPALIGSRLQGACASGLHGRASRRQPGADTA